MVIDMYLGEWCECDDAIFTPFSAETETCTVTRERERVVSPKIEIITPVRPKG